jgi:predicted CoA-binding protein
MIVTEHEREGGGQTVQFMDDAGHELIISVWPYTQLDLTLGREGTPSTVADQPDHLEIVDVVRDDLFTVLFQRNGIRYVVVTLPNHEAWLTDLLTTWQFTN